MAFDRMTDDLDIISKYPDEPYEEDGFTAEAFKASFDRGAKLCKAAINRLVDKLNGKSTGAKYLGFLRSDRVPADNVQDAIDNVQQQIADAYSESAIPDGAVTSAKIDDGAVTTGKIGDGAVTSSKIDYRAVTAGKIAELAVTTAKISDEAVSTEKIAYGAVTKEKIANQAVDTYAIEDGAVTGAKMSDTGWRDVTVIDGFASFSTAAPARYRKIGSVVFLTGALKPTSDMPVTDSGTPVELVAFEMPAGFRPTKTISVLCQGSGDGKWLMQIYANGRVTVSRYSGPEGYKSVLPAGNWLPFHVSFPVD